MPSIVDLTTLSLTGALPGPESAIPTFQSLRALPTIEPNSEIEASMQQRMRRGRLQHSLPYGRQSDYQRSTEPLELPAVVLSNKVLTATVLPTLGGRVWSLWDHRLDQELLFVNPMLRFANLALTDAWFAGGIEWNLGTTGHTTLTSRPLHAARISTPTGEGLRLWEWERTRDLVLQIDLALDDDRLLASTRVINPDPEPKPLYYWSNIAIPETPDTRVLTPASSAWRTSYEGSIRKVTVPYPDPNGADLSYPGRSERAVDYFFDCTPPRFVAAVEADGIGLAQTSTDELRGRKLFLWGTGHGGARWQEWLSGPGTRYAEIQAGWCTTQFEHDEIPGRSEVSWTEAFGSVVIPSDTVNLDYHQAAAAAAAAVSQVVPAERLTSWHRRWSSDVADNAPDLMLSTGSGWGAVEILLRGDSLALPTPALPFPDLNDSAVVGRALLAGDVNKLRACCDQTPIPPISPRWQEILDHPRWDADPWVCYARAVAAHAAGDLETARDCYTRSISLGGRIPAAERGLALISAAAGDVVDAAEHYARACELAPDERTLWTERVEFLLAHNRFDAALAAIEAAPDAVREHGRLQLLSGLALVRSGRQAEAAALLDDLEVPDLAEGSEAVHELWEAVHPGVPIPPRLEFRMI